MNVQEALEMAHQDMDWCTHIFEAAPGEAVHLKEIFEDSGRDVVLEGDGTRWFGCAMGMIEHAIGGCRHGLRSEVTEIVDINNTSNSFEEMMLRLKEAGLAQLEVT